MDFIMLGGLFALALAAEVIDASLGMMFGTILSPVLIIMGFDPLVTVPSLLFAQALGGGIAAVRHHHFGNADFNLMTHDFRSFLFIALPGLLAVAVGSLVAVSIDKSLLKLYIAVLVIVVGLAVLFKLNSRFSWQKMGFIGLVSAFNKAVSGGGFGPFVTGGQIAIGSKSKNAVGVTTLAEVPICVASFAAYFFLKGFSDWPFLGALALGAALGGAIGPHITKKAAEERLKSIVGLMAFALGAFLLLNVLGIIKGSASI